MSTCQLYRCQLKNYKVDRTPERPTNQILHKETEDSLKKMMEIRAQQDQGIFNHVVENAVEPKPANS